MKYEDFHSKCFCFLNRIKLYSDRAIQAIEMIVAHESSCGKHWKQLGGGPARGIIQMERVTHDSVWDNCDNIHKYAKIVGITQDFNKLETDIEYNIFMARMMLIMDVSPLPDNAEKMAHYLKSYWNSDAGKASAAKYLNDWQRWKNAR